ncbi:hypothetical protein KP509_38G015200 [Ceratopteris richardii]|uniref:RRM domain-containing protein n=2 Tax=Ceratopteris richardii TaxID=49495 RepID=A0A8T2Q2L3_CERRI|nr:hypothetical protein KP509_38G015200 [Ceratopteris richardii]
MRCWSPSMSCRVYQYHQGLTRLLRRRAVACSVNAMAASTAGSSAPFPPVCQESLQSSRPLVCRASFSSLTSAGKPLSIEHRSPCTSRFVGFISLHSELGARRCTCCALDPDYYRVQKEEGIPVGVRLKIWNLPPDFKEEDKEDFKAWFGPPDVVNPVLVDKIEITDDPTWVDQNIRAFVDFVNIDYACMAIVKYDGSRYRGRCIRMDFVQKRPHEKEYGGPRSRGFRSNPSGIRRNPNSSFANPSYASSPPAGSVVDNQAAAPSTDGGPPNYVQPGAEGGEPRPNYGPGYGSPRPSSMNRIFVGNLPWSTDDMALQQMFNEFGSVLEARIVRDRDTGRSRGFGFVSMSTPDEMKAAISAMSGKQIDGRSLTVNEAASRF